MPNLASTVHSWEWIAQNQQLIWSYLFSHLAVALPAIAASLLLSVPLARLAVGIRPLRGLIVSVSSLLYAVPSLAMFIILPIVLGTSIRSTANVVVALTLYGMALLVPAATEAFASVDPKVLDAATAQGMTPTRRFVLVDLPLAGPTILAGLRVVTVSTISLTTVGAVLGIASLGRLFTDGFQRGLSVEIITGLVLTMILALALDSALTFVGRLLLPWTRTAGQKQLGAGA